MCSFDLGHLGAATGDVVLNARTATVPDANPLFTAIPADGALAYSRQEPAAWPGFSANTV